MLRKEYVNINTPNGCYPIKAKDINGTVRDYDVSVFKLRHFRSDNTQFEGYEFRVTLKKEKVKEYLFLEVTKFDFYQNTMILSKGGNNLRQKGIPEQLILVASQHLNSSIYSSTNIDSEKQYDIDERNDNGEKVWKRLKNLHSENVSYHKGTDRYKLCR